MIEVNGLSKHFKVHKRPPGLGAALRSLVHRTYETVRAVEDVTFSIGAGARVGFLGPNGAGKTTTLKVLAGLLHPTAGQVRVLGRVPERRERELLSQITLVMGQKQQLLWDLPPSDTFAMNRAIYDLPARTFEETLGELVRLLEIADVIGKPTRKLSLGERMKCELAAALLHRPQVLFLDEPTIGLDIGMQATVRRFVREYNERFGATVILTSHYMDDVAALCPRIIVIDKGRLTFDGALDALVHRMRPNKRVRVRLSRPIAREEAARFGTVVALADGEVTLDVQKADVSACLGALLGALPCTDLTVEDPPLEEVVQDLFERTRAAQGA